MTEKLHNSLDFGLHGKDKKSQLVEEPPPFLKRWSRVYTIVMINLVFWLVTFYFIRRIFE